MAPNRSDRQAVRENTGGSDADNGEAVAQADAKTSTDADTPLNNPTRYIHRDENFIGASTATWLRDVAKVLNRRFDPDGRKLEFRKSVDPMGLLNPGKLRSLS